MTRSKEIHKDPNWAKAEEILHQTLAEHYNEMKDEADEIETTIVEEFEQLSSYVRTADTRNFCILLTSFLEDALRANFVRYWRIDSSALRDNFFGSNGPLATFSQRMLVATAIGWIPDEAAKDAGILRKIRNELAHNHRVHRLSEPPLTDLAENLHLREGALEGIQQYQEALEKLEREQRLRLRIFCASAVIVGQMLFRAKMFRHGLGPLRREGGYEGLTGIERRMIDLTVDHCFRVVGLK